VAHKVDDMITKRSCAVAKPINEAKRGTTSVAKAVYVFFGGWRRTMRRYLPQSGRTTDDAIR